MNLPETPLCVLRFDGACSPNPGPMGIGYTIHRGESRVGGQGTVDNSPALVRVGAQVGKGTNNIAEYMALVAGLRHALRLGMFRLSVRSDSMLVVRQLQGLWKVKDGTLRKHHAEARTLLSMFRWYTLDHIYREENAEADALSHEMVYEEPTLPLLPPHRLLHTFQAAAVREWWAAGVRNSYLLSRIFPGTRPVTVEQVGSFKAYKYADFTDLPSYGPTWLEGGGFLPIDGPLPLPTHETEPVTAGPLIP